MKRKTLFLPLVATLLTFTAVSCKKQTINSISELKVENIETLEKTGGNNYDYILKKGNGTNEPIKKECGTPNGSSCKKTAKADLSNYEYTTFFHGLTEQEILEYDINNYQAWLDYQREIGFGH
jgi:hypothetical protein